MAEEYIITLNHAQINRPEDMSQVKAQSCFCKVRYSHQEHKTKVMNNLTKPEFMETFRFKKVKMDDDLILELWDWESQIKSDVIAVGTFNLRGMKFKKNMNSTQDLFFKTGKTEKKIATMFFEIEYTREGIESEQEKEHKNLIEKPKEEEKEEPEPPKKKKDPLPMFELPKRERKKPVYAPKKLLGESYSNAVEEFGSFNLEFENFDFNLDEKVRNAIMMGLHELGRAKPKNPVKFMGDFLMNYH